jgi:hypothetical protein
MAAEFDYDSCVRGYHVYQSIWIAIPGQMFSCEIEEGNTSCVYKQRHTNHTVCSAGSSSTRAMGVSQLIYAGFILAVYASIRQSPN